MILVADIISEARELTNDKFSPYREEDSTFITWINNGVNLIVRARPDSLISDDGSLADENIITQTTDSVNLPQNFKSALVYYICHMFFDDESFEKDNVNKSKKYKNSFEEEVSL